MSSLVLVCLVTSVHDTGIGNRALEVLLNVPEEHYV